MIKLLKKAKDTVVQNKGVIISTVKDEAVDLATATVHGFVNKYLIFGNLIFALGGFVVGCVFTMTLFMIF